MNRNMLAIVEEELARRDVEGEPEGPKADT
jgi:hypothetical protein